MVILGGVGLLYGGVAGAWSAMLLLEEILSSWTEQEAGAWPGAAVRRFARAARHRQLVRGRTMAEALLEVRGLYKHFGGVVATDHLDLAVAAGRVHALIGPNGAGKTTLVAQICGEVEPDSGQVLFDGEDISALRAHERVAAGLARSFQITRIFGNLAAGQHCAGRAGAQRQQHAFLGSGRIRAVNEEIDALVEELGLADIRSQRAASLPHAGQRRVWRWRSPVGRACCCSTSRSPGWASRKPRR